LDAVLLLGVDQFSHPVISFCRNVSAFFGDGDRKCKERQRYDAETDGRRETMKREKEPGDSRRNGCNEKPFRPEIEPIASKHSEHNDEAGENCGQADQW
jgi:hypothetical protein